MNFKTCLFSLSLFSTILSAQISGTVTDRTTGKHISNVNVTSINGGTVTNELGQFSIDVPFGSELDFSHIGYKSVTQFAKSNMLISLSQTVIESDEIIVRAGLKDESLQGVTGSVTILSEETIRQSGANHFQSLTEQVPNLSWAGGTSRPRYFQIRGIGERSHYFGEGAPNFSVGFVVDDMDLSGLGMVAHLNDINQIEIFKGPQSSVFGANAMGGLISMRSNDPINTFDMASSFSFGSDNHYGGHGLVNLNLFSGLSMRLSLAKSYQDGFRENVSKNIKNTNKREESMSRIKLNYALNDNLNILSTIIYSDLQNGYDAWAPDNNENYKTYTNDDGEDSQLTYGYSVRGNFQPTDEIQLTSITSFTETDLTHAYDGDWGDSTYWHDNHGFDPAAEGWAYKFYDKNEKNRANLTQEMRASWNSVLIGGYYKHLKEQDAAEGWLFGGIATEAISAYDFISTAVYSQVGFNILPSLKFTGNIRIEKNEYDYTGTARGLDDYWEPIALESVNFISDFSMIGYRASLLYDMNQSSQYFGSISKGYKSGGVNQQPYLADENRPFNPEYINNIEFGLRNQSVNHRFQLNAFYATRVNQQVTISSQQVEGDPNSFLFYTANAGSGRNYGFEFEYLRQVSDHIQLNTMLSHLNTFVDEFEYDSDEGMVKSGGRAAAMAPKFMASFGFQYDVKGYSVAINSSFKDEYYFSDSHDEISEPYMLTNLTIRKSFGKFDAKLWVTNLLDERYATRGFYFGLIPPDYPDQLWKSYGDPRHLGFTLDYNF